MKAKKTIRTGTEPRRAPLTICDSEHLQWAMQQVQLAIAGRAYELFEARGQEHGHDWEDWFKAESELLRPVSVATSESADSVSVRVNVLGFDENELKVSVEPHRIIVIGKKASDAAETSRYPDQILSVIDLPAEVDPERASVEVGEEVLICKLPKALRRRSSPKASAA
jgi:HSP20 family molecular chaperone IbpA